ncbi:MAG: hypothetical protein AAFQ94_07425, partial [Bacteroidota bacterium]
SCNPKTLTNKALEEIEVKIIIQSTADYCGGANPPEQLLERLKTAKLLANTELIIKNNEKDFQEMVKTDEQGEINKSLPAGDYQIYFPEKISAKPMERAINKDYCLKWKNTPDATIQVTNEQSSFELKLHRSCNPCELARP